MSFAKIMYRCGKSKIKAIKKGDNRKYSIVAFTYKISNKFIEDMQRIMDFVEHKHIAL